MYATCILTVYSGTYSSSSSSDGRSAALRCIEELLEQCITESQLLQAASTFIPLYIFVKHMLSCVLAVCMNSVGWYSDC